MPATNYLIALDWGTSSLRAALMDGGGRVLGEVSTSDGILSAAAGPGFRAVFDRVVGPWLQDYRRCCTVLAAGMIGSRQGWREAAYLPCPAGFHELGDGLVWMNEGGLSLGLVPGLSMRHVDGIPDVMRGEEVQVFGALDELGIDDGVFVLPGTHSKWVIVENRRIVRFHTYMTGELFALLRQHSILSRLMPDRDTTPWVDGRDSFAKACTMAAEGMVLHRLFSIRSQGLLGQLPSDQQSDYLSGLLIGEELREALASTDSPAPAHVYLLCNAALFERYHEALSVFGIDSSCCTQQASFRGIHAIAREQGLFNAIE